MLRELLAKRDDVRLVFRHFPLVDVHPFAYSGALALEAAATAGRFWELHDLLLARQESLGRRVLTTAAEELGLAPSHVLRPASERYDAFVPTTSTRASPAVSRGRRRAGPARGPPVTATARAVLPRSEITSAARDYLRTESGSAVLLLVATVTALVWANSPWSDSYHSLWDTTLSFRLGDRELSDTLGHWVNDGLMTLFFLLLGLEIARELSVGEYRDRRSIIVPAAAALGGLVVQALHDVGTGGLDLVAAGLPGLRDRLQHLAEARHPLLALERPVGAAEERLACGGEEAGHRPAAVAGHRLHGLHVNRVDIRPLLAVDLDVDEVLVHVRRGRLVLEGLVRHHVAPVASGVADR